jgi:hypothetical protein
MAISYPLSLPDNGFAEIHLAPLSNTAMTRSVFSLTQQVYEHTGEQWLATLSFRPMSRADAAPWQAVLAALRGPKGTLLLGDPKAASPRGAWAGTPLVNGANASGSKTLAVKGLTASTTIKAGDYLQVGSGASTRLYMVLTDAAADGSGLATLDIFPRLREALSDGAAITKTNCKGTFRLASNEDAGWSSDPAGAVTLDQVRLIEAI